MPYKSLGPKSGKRPPVVQVGDVWVTACWICGARLVFTWKPERIKCCDKHHTPRPAEESDRALFVRVAGE